MIVFEYDDTLPTREDDIAMNLDLYCACCNWASYAKHLL